MVKENQRVGCNGGVAKFVGKWLRDQRLLPLDTINRREDAKFPQSYDGSSCISSQRRFDIERQAPTSLRLQHALDT
jgi:hypothetical protein